MTKFKLSAGKKAKWVKALRSGKYNQCTGKLWGGGAGKESAYCCLGVARAKKLCKGSKKGDISGVKLVSDGDPIGYREQCFVSEQFLPLVVQEKLAHFNDTSKWSFKKIANWIEKNL